MTIVEIVVILICFVVVLGLIWKFAPQGQGKNIALWAVLIIAILFLLSLTGFFGLLNQRIGHGG